LERVCGSVKSREEKKGKKKIGGKVFMILAKADHVLIGSSISKPK